MKPKRHLRNEVTSFPEYILLFAKYFEYIRYSEMNAIYEAILDGPKQRTILSEMTLKNWIIPMTDYIVIDSNDSDDGFFSVKSYGKLDDGALDLYFRRDICHMENSDVMDGFNFNRDFRHILLFSPVTK